MILVPDNIGAKIHKIYNRKLLGKLRKWVDKRQAGKTTLFRLLFDQIESANKVFLDMENSIVQKTFEETAHDNIWANLKTYGLSSREKAYIFLMKSNRCQEWQKR